jgi:transmembrane sensor
VKPAGNLTYLFERFLKKECTREELQELFVHFGTADKVALKTLIRRELEKKSLKELVPDPEKMGQLFREITAQIHYKEKKAYRYRLAAALVGALLLVGGYFLLPSEPARLVASAARGKLRELRLPDGSKVWLDAGTQINYPAHFTGRSRTVVMTGGAAFFDVVHDARQPFIVRTPTAIVTVLGTSFEVTAIGRTTRVAVKTGKVGVQPIGRVAAFLKAGQATVTGTGQPVVLPEPVADIAAWRERKLVFDDQPLGEVMERLEREYDVQIEIQNKALLSERVSMRLDNQPLSDVFNALSFANHFNYAINGQLIVIK